MDTAHNRRRLGITSSHVHVIVSTPGCTESGESYKHLFLKCGSTRRPRVSQCLDVLYPA